VNVKTLHKFYFLVYLKNAIGIFIAIEINLYIAFSSMIILPLLILQIHEHGIAFEKQKDQIYKDRE
jgi:hypothetical protein